MYYESTMTRMGYDESGKDKKFTEKYLTAGLSIVEALARFEENISKLYPDHETKSIKRTGYSEVITDNDADCRYFHVTYNTIISDDNGKEKKSSVTVLIQANDFDDAKSKFNKIAMGYIIDVELVKITETKTLEYFPYENLQKSE